MLATASTEVENIGDILEIHMYHLAGMCAAGNIKFDEQELSTLNEYHGKVLSAFTSVMAALEHDRREAAEMILEMEEEIVDGMDKTVRERQKQLLKEEHTTQEMAAFTLQTDIMENFKRIFEHTKRIANLVTRQEGSTAMVVAD